MPDSISIIGGAPEGEPQPMHYFDEPRRPARLYLMTLDGSTWTIWRAPGEDWTGPAGPGFNQRFIGEISADGMTIEGRWERGMGDAGDRVGGRLPDDLRPPEPQTLDGILRRRREERLDSGPGRDRDARAEDDEYAERRGETDDRGYQGDLGAGPKTERAEGADGADEQGVDDRDHPDRRRQPVENIAHAARGHRRPVEREDAAGVVVEAR